MTISLINNPVPVVGDGAATTTSVEQSAGACNQGDLMIVWGRGDAGTLSIADTLNSSWTLYQSVAPYKIWWAPVPAAGNPTITVSSTVDTVMGIMVMVLRGTDITNPLYAWNHFQEMNNYISDYAVTASAPVLAGDAVIASMGPEFGYDGPWRAGSSPPNSNYVNILYGVASARNESAMSWDGSTPTAHFSMENNAMMYASIVIFGVKKLTAQGLSGTLVPVTLNLTAVPLGNTVPSNISLVHNTTPDVGDGQTNRTSVSQSPGVCSANDLMIVWGSAWSGNSSISDSLGSSWNLYQTVGPYKIWWAKVPAGGGSPTITVSSTVDTVMGMMVMVLRGTDVTNPFYAWNTWQSSGYVADYGVTASDVVNAGDAVIASMGPENSYDGPWTAGPASPNSNFVSAIIGGYNQGARNESEMSWDGSTPTAHFLMSFGAISGEIVVIFGVKALGGGGGGGSGTTYVTLSPVIMHLTPVLITRQGSLNRSLTPVTLTLTARPIGGHYGGKVKVWSGTEWVESIMKVWNGNTWVEHPVMVWNGTIWETL